MSDVECVLCHAVDHWPAATFCHHCGTRLRNQCIEEDCPVADVDPGYRYCPMCGKRTLFASLGITDEKPPDLVAQAAEPAPAAGVGAEQEDMTMRATDTSGVPTEADAVRSETSASAPVEDVPYSATAAEADHSVAEDATPTSAFDGADAGIPDEADGTALGDGAPAPCADVPPADTPAEADGVASDNASPMLAGEDVMDSMSGPEEGVTPAD